MYGLSSCVEDDRLGRHVSVDDRKAVRFGRPADIVDRSFFIEVDSRVESTVRAQQVHGCFAVIALPGLVDLGLRQDDECGACIVPLELDLVTLEEVLLRDGCGEVGDVVDSNGGWLALFLSALVIFLLV